ncbi:hypothetical protein [Herbaspirillum huttiense]|uniref:hypothetical protein n=1 Tax=Herbaspirillum huttiense TaxID=863372 RepID=UPI0039AF93D5
MDNTRADVSFDIWWREVITLWRRAGKIQSIKEATLLDLYTAGLLPAEALNRLLEARQGGADDFQQ